MTGNNIRLLQAVNDSDDILINVKGHFLCFDNEDSPDMLLAISLIFSNAIIVIEAQTDDTLKLISKDEWQSTESFYEITLSEQMPWIKAKGKPLLWSWALFNQQGYFDGVQLEFSKNVSDDAVIIQLIALGSEIILKTVSSLIK